MGSPPHEKDSRSDEAAIDATLTHGFWTAKHEVTRGQWKRVMGEVPAPLSAGEGDDFPVYWVTYSDAESFCQRLTSSGRSTGERPLDWQFRLPTEVQWEYACRTSNIRAFAFGGTLTVEHANIGKPYDGTPDGTPGSAASEVGIYPSNAWGLHDMHGNGFEWCRNWYHARLPGGIDPDLSQVKG